MPITDDVINLVKDGVASALGIALNDQLISPELTKALGSTLGSSADLVASLVTSFALVYVGDNYVQDYAEQFRVAGASVLGLALVKKFIGLKDPPAQQTKPLDNVSRIPMGVLA